jgi:ABC-type Zn2+ transport system substrate-binding protein/surface adhesin
LKSIEDENEDEDEDEDDDHDDDDDDYDDDDDADDEIRITSCYYYVSPFNQHLGILFRSSVAIWVVLFHAQVQPDSEVRIRQ